MLQPEIKYRIFKDYFLKFYLKSLNFPISLKSFEHLELLIYKTVNNIYPKTNQYDIDNIRKSYRLLAVYLFSDSNFEKLNKFYEYH